MALVVNLALLQVLAAPASADCGSRVIWLICCADHPDGLCRPRSLRPLPPDRFAPGSLEARCDRCGAVRQAYGSALGSIATCFRTPTA
jgi:hypothetical protein